MLDGKMIVAFILGVGFGAVAFHLATLERSPQPRSVRDAKLEADCPALAEKLYKSLYNPHGKFAFHSARYHPSDKHCYVEVSVVDGNKEYSRYLFDAASGGMVAALREIDGKRNGSVFDECCSSGDPAAAEVYIYQKMIRQ